MNPAVSSCQQNPFHVAKLALQLNIPCDHYEPIGDSIRAALLRAFGCFSVSAVRSNWQVAARWAYFCFVYRRLLVTMPLVSILQWIGIQGTMKLWRIEDLRCACNSHTAFEWLTIIVAAFECLIVFTRNACIIIVVVRSIQMGCIDLDMIMCRLCRRSLPPRLYFVTNGEKIPTFR